MAKPHRCSPSKHGRRRSTPTRGWRASSSGCFAPRGRARRARGRAEGAIRGSTRRASNEDPERDPAASSSTAVPSSCSPTWRSATCRPPARSSSQIPKTAREHQVRVAALARSAGILGVLVPGEGEKLAALLMAKWRALPRPRVSYAQHEPDPRVAALAGGVRDGGKRPRPLFAWTWQPLAARPDIVEEVITGARVNLAVPPRARARGSRPERGQGEELRRRLPPRLRRGRPPARRPGARAHAGAHAEARRPALGAAPREPRHEEPRRRAAHRAPHRRAPLAAHRPRAHVRSFLRAGGVRAARLLVLGEFYEDARAAVARYHKLAGEKDLPMTKAGSRTSSASSTRRRRRGSAGTPAPARRRRPSRDCPPTGGPRPRARGRARALSDVIAPLRGARPRPGVRRPIRAGGVVDGAGRRAPPSRERRSSARARSISRSSASTPRGRGPRSGEGVRGGLARRGGGGHRRRGERRGARDYASGTPRLGAPGPEEEGGCRARLRGRTLGLRQAAPLGGARAAGQGCRWRAGRRGAGVRRAGPGTRRGA